MFDNLYSGAVITDPDGYVIRINKQYAQFLRVDPEVCIGKHCTEVVENTRMHVVAKTGKAELNHTQIIRGENIIVHRIPIRKDGNVIAVLGLVMFQDLGDLQKLWEKVSLLKSKVKLYEQELLNLRSVRYTFDSIIGISQAIKTLKRNALKATANTYPVLITGQSGTGKELFAQAIHHASARKIYPFVRINCAAIPKDLLESELFGYEKGAFTGASASGKPGKFELAHRGTIFLDEIGDMPLEMQPKILRVLEEKEFERVGGRSVIKSDFRLIAATNQDLEEQMNAGRFRKDLFYRLNVIHLHIPPLKERKDDILLLWRHLLKQLSGDVVYSEIRTDPDAEKALTEYDWHGNVRELSNTVERTMSALEGDTIRLSDLPFHICRHCYHHSENRLSSVRNIKEKLEIEAIRSALKEADNNKSRAAGILGIHRTLLYKKMNKYGIDL